VGTTVGGEATGAPPQPWVASGWAGFGGLLGGGGHDR
jgi:hypothetical protein